MVVDILRNVSIFSGLDARQLAELEALAVVREYTRGTLIIREGDVANSLYVLLDGRVRVYVSDEEGKEFVLNTLGPGDYMGEYALLDDETRTASVEAEETVSCLVLQKEAFGRMLARHDSMRQQLTRNLVERIRQLTEQVKALALSDVYGRLRKLFYDLAVQQHGLLVVNEAFTQQDLANRVGSSREMVARIMKTLTTAGYVRVDDKKQIVLLKHLPESY